MTRRQAALIGLGVFSFLLILLAVVAAFVYVGFLRAFREIPTEDVASIADRAREVPAALKEPRVVKGPGALTKSLWSEAPDVGMVTDIAWGQFDGKPGEEFVVVGTQGATFVTERGEEKATVTFDWRAIGQYFGQHVVVVDMEGDGKCEFFDRAGAWVPPVVLLSHAGKPLWQYTDEWGVDNAVAGDVNGDGKVEIAVGLNGGGGVRLLDADGKPLWRQPDGNVWHVEMLDLDGDGKDEIVHSNVGGQITARDAQGEVLWRREPAVRVADFCLTHWAGLVPAAVVVEEGGYLSVLDLQGEEQASARLPLGEVQAAGWVEAAPVAQAEQNYLAVMLGYSVPERALFFLFDQKFGLLYHEVLGANGEALFAGGPLSGKGKVLVGEEGRVWEYTLPAGASTGQYHSPQRPRWPALTPCGS